MSQISIPTSQPEVHASPVTPLSSLKDALASITTANELASLIAEATIHNENGVISLSAPSFSGRVSVANFILTLMRIDQHYHSLTVFEIPFEERFLGIGCRENLRAILMSNEKESFFITFFKQAAFFMAPCFSPPKTSENEDPDLLIATKYMETKESAFTRMWIGRDYRYISHDEIDEYAPLFSGLAHANSESLQKAKAYYHQALTDIEQIYDGFYTS